MSFKDIQEQVIGTINDTLGESVVYTSGILSPVTITAVFHNAWVDNVHGVVTLKPVLRVRISDLPADPAIGDTILIDSVNYKVNESRKDAFGGSTLILQKG